MINIRQNIFETNSSSTHAVALVTEKQYRRWQKNDDVYLCFSSSYYDIPTVFSLDEFVEFLYNTDQKYDKLRTAFCESFSGQYKIADNTISFYDCVDKPINVRELKVNDHDQILSCGLRFLDILESDECEVEFTDTTVKDPLTGKPRIIVSAEIWG